MLVRALCGNALELGAICCQPTSGSLVIPHSDVDVQGTSHCWSSSKHLGHYVTKLFQVSTIGQLEGRGKGCEPVVEPVSTSDATVFFFSFATNHAYGKAFNIRHWNQEIAKVGWQCCLISFIDEIGGNLVWTTSSTSAGFECKLNFLYIFSNLFTFHFFFTPVPNEARHFFFWRTGWTRLDSTLFSRTGTSRAVHI